MKSSLNERISEAVLKSSLMPFQSSDAMTFEIKTFEIDILMTFYMDFM